MRPWRTEIEAEIVSVNLFPSSTVIFAEYSLKVRYIRCLDPNIKRTYEYLSKSGNVQRMFGEGYFSNMALWA